MRKWIEIIREADEPITFEFDPSEDAYRFDGFGVYAILLGGSTICEFGSSESGQGNGEKAIRWLKDHCEELCVSDPGEPGTDSFGFWAAMCRKGLIDAMEDEHNNIIYQDGSFVQGEDFDYD